MPKIQILFIRRNDGVHYKTEGVVPAKYIQPLSDFVSQSLDYFSRTAGPWTQISCSLDFKEVDAKASRKSSTENARVKAHSGGVGQEPRSAGIVGGDIERYRSSDDQYSQEASTSTTVLERARRLAGQGEVQPRNDSPVD